MAHGARIDRRELVIELEGHEDLSDGECHDHEVGRQAAGDVRQVLDK
jgi:hypothetical protein